MVNLSRLVFILGCCVMGVFFSLEANASFLSYPVFRRIKTVQSFPSCAQLSHLNRVSTLLAERFGFVPCSYTSPMFERRFAKVMGIKNTFVLRAVIDKVFGILLRNELSFCSGSRCQICSDLVGFVEINFLRLKKLATRYQLESKMYTLKRLAIISFLFLCVPISWFVRSDVAERLFMPLNKALKKGFSWFFPVFAGLLSFLGIKELVLNWRGNNRYPPSKTFLCACCRNDGKVFARHERLAVDMEMLADRIENMRGQIRQLFGADFVCKVDNLVSKATNLAGELPEIVRVLFSDIENFRDNFQKRVYCFDFADSLIFPSEIRSLFLASQVEIATELACLRAKILSLELSKTTDNSDILISVERPNHNQDADNFESSDSSESEKGSEATTNFSGVACFLFSGLSSGGFGGQTAL